MPRRRTSAKDCVPQQKEIKVAIYIRVSTTHQIDRDSIPMQKKDLMTYCEFILNTDNYVIFEDAGYSGKNTVRPAYQKMMDRVRNDEFTHILVWKIDRISRNLLDFASMYQELKKLGVVFISKNEQFDTGTAIGEAMLKIILVFAELERNMTSERVTATMISRASNGQWNGGRIPFGYSYDSDTSTFSVREDEAAICRKLRDLYLENKSLIYTARALNAEGFKTRAGVDWTPPAVWIIASSPFYAGIYRYNRYKGTVGRTINSEDEWVVIPNHHPAIFSLAEHEAMKSLLKTNSRNIENPVGRLHTTSNVHIFQGIAYCGKCKSRLTSSPGRKSSTGFQASNYSCPLRRKSKKCNNKTINDIVLGEFVINYILNMLNAKKMFSKIKTPDELQKQLLCGSTFSGIDHIDADGLNEYYNLLSRYSSDNSFIFAKRPQKKKAAVSKELASLRKEKERQERAMTRLQDLYLYSENAMSEKDFIIRKEDISYRLKEINHKLGVLSDDSDSFLSDEEFIKQASHFLIQSELKNKKYIYFKNLVNAVSPEILKSYIDTILDSVYITDSKVTSIVFKNGLTHNFIYK
nr:recombinase family protein [uncultured Anaerobutyricum sp.]